MVFMPHWPKVLGQKPIYYDLERINALMHKLGNPHKNLPPVIHVAGTNGKGSTIAFMRSMLEAAGYKVHVYTSPHLLNFNERIVLAGKEISNEYLTQIMEECRIAAGDMLITFFEGTTAGAMLAFSKIDADIVLLETGMGGRLDATNIIERPVLNVITPISIDHTEYLGPDIATIAGEKAGIMRQDVTCVSSLQHEVAEDVLHAYAEKIEANMFSLGYDWIIEKGLDSLSFQSKVGDITDLPMPSLFGDHQVVNAGTAVAAMLCLNDFNISEDAIRHGIQNTSWAARMQPVSSGYLMNLLPEGWEIWVDGVHNEAGAQMLSLALKDLDDRPTYIICGFTKGRKPETLLKYVKGQVNSIATVIIHTEPSAQSPESVAKEAREIGFNAESFDTIEQALEFFTTQSDMPARVVFFGSLYLASDALLLNNTNTNRKVGVV